MVKEKRILSYLLGWLIIGYIICFIGINNVFAEEITPTEIKSQIRTIYADGTTQWYTSGNNTYTTPLYFGTGPTYSTYGIPCNFRLLVVSNIDSQYSYKYSYDMHIFTPYSTNNTWDSSKIDSLYDLKVLDDAGIVKESKCSVVSTEKNTNAEGIFMNKKISCVFTVNKSYTNGYISAGYFCKGNCELSNMEPLGFIPQDSYMSIDNVRTEKLSDNSNVIIDQNQTIIDQNNKTNQELGEIKDEIKDQLNTCRKSYNLLDISNFGSNTNNGINWSLSSDKITIKSIGTLSQNYSETNRYSTSLSPGTYKFYIFDTDVKVGIWLYNSSSTTPLATVYNNQTFTINETVTRYAFFFEGSRNKEYNFSFKPAISLSSNIMSKYEKFGEEICSNKIDETNDKLDNLQGAITDSSAPNTSGLENSAGWLPAGPLDSVLNLPLSLFNALTTNLNKSCNPINIPLPYVNKNITLPCINSLYNQIGITSFLSWIGVIVSGLMLYTYLLKLYKWIEDRISLNETHNVDSWGGL